MMIVRILLIVLLFGMSPSTRQGQEVDVTNSTRWQDTQTLKITGRNIKFRPEQDLGDGAKACPQLIIDIRFRNRSEKAIRQIVFAIVIYANKSRTQDDDSTAISWRFNYDHLLSPGGTGGLLNELGDCKLYLPARQTVRVVRIVYEDGSSEES